MRLQMMGVEHPPVGPAGRMLRLVGGGHRLHERLSLLIAPLGEEGERLIGEKIRIPGKVPCLDDQLSDARGAFALRDHFGFLLPLGGRRQGIVQQLCASRRWSRSTAGARRKRPSMNAPFSMMTDRHSDIASDIGLRVEHDVSALDRALHRSVHDNGVGLDRPTTCAFLVIMSGAMHLALDLAVDLHQALAGDAADNLQAFAIICVAFLRKHGRPLCNT